MLAAGSRFPSVSLSALDGAPRLVSEAWVAGAALIVIGHRDCRTTREALPLVDRIHRRRRRGTVLVVLQDDAAAAGALVSELGLAAPVLLEADPFPLARELGLQAVPTLALVDGAGRIDAVSEGLSQEDLSALAARLGVDGPLFTAEDSVPAFRPG